MATQIPQFVEVYKSYKTSASVVLKHLGIYLCIELLNKIWGNFFKALTIFFKCHNLIDLAKIGKTNIILNQGRQARGPISSRPSRA